MLDPGLLVTYVAACFLFSIVPGPSVTVVLANSLARGTKAGLLTILGTEISMLSMVIVVALGLEVVMQAVGQAFVWIKLIGAAYLLWIGWQMLTTGGHLDVEKAKAPRSAWRFVWQGALINWSNPKTLLFLGAFLPQFVKVGEGAFFQIMVLGLIVMAVATFTDGIYAVLAGSLRGVLTAARVRVVSRISGAILICGGIWLALLKRV